MPVSIAGPPGVEFGKGRRQGLGWGPGWRQSYIAVSFLLYLRPEPGWPQDLTGLSGHCPAQSRESARLLGSDLWALPTPDLLLPKPLGSWSAPLSSEQAIQALGPAPRRTPVMHRPHVLVPAFFLFAFFNIYIYIF